MAGTREVTADLPVSLPVVVEVGNVRSEVGTLELGNAGIAGQWTAQFAALLRDMADELDPSAESTGQRRTGGLNT